MNISAEEKNRYLREAEVVLAREGFLTDRTHAGSLRVLFDGAPLCEVPQYTGTDRRQGQGLQHRQSRSGVYVSDGAGTHSEGGRS